MVKVFKWLLLGVLALMGLAWKLVQGFFELMPGTVQRTEVPFEPESATHTWDGKTIID